MKTSRIIRLSRPRFWLYELGTYFLGVVAGAIFVGQVYSPIVLIYALFFLFPANLLIYGINDIYDYETDKLNPKKTGYEDLLDPSLHKKVFTYIFITNIPFIIFGFFIPFNAFISLILFFFFASFYSAKPIRAKARPVLDSIFSASHYVITAVFGFYLVGGQEGIFLPVLAGLLWAISMHAYSAVPDIEADKKSGIETIATKLGKNKTIILCSAFYFFAGLIVFQYFYWAILLAIPYLFLMYKSLGANDQKLFSLYKIFPKLNALIGMAIFFSVFFRNF